MAADSCVRCGTRVVSGADFCHRCGLKLDVVVAELDVFAPPGSSPQGYTDSEPSGERLKTAMGVAAVLGLVALAVVYIGGAETEPVAHEAASNELSDDGDAEVTDDEVEQAAELTDGATTDLTARAVGRLIERSSAEVGVGLPVSVVRHNNELMVFVAPRASYFSPNVGLDLWVGPELDQLTRVPGVLPEGAVVSDVAVVDGGLLAVGQGELGDLTAWRSDDGRSWKSEPLPGSDPDGSWPMVGRRIHVGDAGIGVLASGQDQTPFGPAAATFLEDLGLSLADLDSYDLYRESDSISLGARFGFRLATATFDELGLDESTMNGRQPPMIWLFDDGTGWEWQELEWDWVQSVGTDDQGGFYGIGWGDAGQELVRSTDGRSWTGSRLSGDLTSLIPSGDGLLVTFQSDLALRVGNEFDKLDMRDLIPSAADGGRPHSITAVGSGAAVAWEFWGGPRVTSPPSASLLKDGFVLATEDGWTLELSRDRDVVWRSTGREDSYDVDLESRTITLLDQETGAAIVGFTVAELQQLADQVNQRDKLVSDQVLFSYDLENWYRALIGGVSNPATVWHEGIEFIDGGVAVFGYRGGTQWGFASPSLELWIFDLPPN